MSNIQIDVVYERQWSSLGNLIHALSQMQVMGHFYGGFPKYRYIAQGIPANLIRTYPLASVWNLLISKTNLPRNLSLNEPKTIGKWVANKKDLAPTIISNGTAHRFLFPLIKDTGRTLILERGSMYPLEYFHFHQRARQEAGYPYKENLPECILDEIEKTKLADFVIAGSQMVRQSYIDHGFASDRVFDCRYGIHSFPFVERKAPVHRPVRIGVAGVIGFRKGLFRILKIGSWAQKAGIHVEIHFAGPIQDQESNEMFAKTRADYHLLGTIKGQKLKDFLSSCDLYLLPSYEEGLPFSVLESMSTGLAAIVSNDTGAREAIEDGISGINLSAFTDEEFDAKLAPILSSPERILEMGRAAHVRIESEFTLAHFCKRMNIALAQIQKLKPQN